MLVPLQYRPRLVVLVGDPQQLPPTILSQHAKVGHISAVHLGGTSRRHTCISAVHLGGISRRDLAQVGGLERSLFERLQLRGVPCSFLGTQYRMHPAIRSFPADHFYDRRLVDADVVARNARRTPGTLGPGHAGQ